MSLYGSLFSGVTGLTAQSRALGTISENITNINTVGFKAQTTHFSTLVAAGNAGSTPGVGGVLHTTAKSIDTQGILQTTESPTDIAIAGSGFFVVNSDVIDGRATGDTMFTRAGHFAINKDSHLANAAGHFLMGWKLDKDGEFIDDVGNVIIPDPTSEGDLLPVDLGDVTFTSEGTDNISIKATFPAQMTIGDEFSASSRLFDDLGGDHSLDFGFTKADHIQMAGTLVETEGGAVPALITVAPVVTPAALVGVDESTSATEVGYTLERTDVNADGDVTWTVTVNPVNGSIAADSSGTFDLVFNSAGTLTDSDMREVEIEWEENLKAKNSIFAFDPSEINFVTESATPAMASTLNPGGAVLKLDINSSNLDDDILSGGDSFVQFNTSGDLINPASLVIEVDYSNLATFAPNTTVSIDLGTPNTQTGLSVNGSNFVLNSTSQDGVAFGAFSGVTIDDDGFVIANFKNGTFLPVYRLPLADFSNSNGLRAETGNAFKASLESGDFFLNQAGVGGVGTIVPRALEQSTVDIAREFTNMIITQRAFSAASTAITTADEMLQELVQIKR